MNNVRTIGWVAGCAVAVALGGCRSASTRIYTLGAAAPVSHIDFYHAPALRIDTLNVPVSWDTSDQRLRSLGCAAGPNGQAGPVRRSGSTAPVRQRHLSSTAQAKRCVGRQRRYPGIQHPRLAGLDASELDYRSIWERPGRETQRRGIAQLYEFRRPGSSCPRLE